jgi:hypothetical protein
MVAAPVRLNISPYLAYMHEAKIVRTIANG